MKIALLLLLSLNAYAFKAVNFSARFGSAQVDSEDATSSGTGFMIQSELFIENNWGVIATYGYTDTESDDEVATLSGNLRSELSIQNSYLQGGVFYYILPGLRAAAGLSYHSIDVEINEVNRETDESSENYLGYFASIGYAHAFSSIILGAEYNMIKFDEYDQSGLFLIVGLLF